MSPINLPPPTPLSAETLRTIADRHRVTNLDTTDNPVSLTQTGMINTVYALGDHLVLRIPRNHPAHIAQLERERLAIPAARAAGVRTPALVAYDDTLDLLPVPYAIVERVDATPLELLTADVRAAPEVWRQLGRDLALLHTRVTHDGPAAALGEGTPTRDPRELTDLRAAEGWYTP